jgi:prepilin-type N-terminal cleavage/methylation domain-containing protein
MNSRGFTLMELMIAIIVSTIVAAGAFSFYTTSIAGVYSFYRGPQLLRERNRAVTAMAHQCRRSSRLVSWNYDTLRILLQGDTLSLPPHPVFSDDAAKKISFRFSVQEFGRWYGVDIFGIVSVSKTTTDTLMQRVVLPRTSPLQ